MSILILQGCVFIRKIVASAFTFWGIKKCLTLNLVSGSKLNLVGTWQTQKNSRVFSE